MFWKLIRFQPRTLAPLAPLHPRPASGIVFVPHTMPPAQPIPQRSCLESASGESIGEFSCQAREKLSLFAPALVERGAQSCACGDFIKMCPTTAYA